MTWAWMGCCTELLQTGSSASCLLPTYIRRDYQGSVRRILDVDYRHNTVTGINTYQAVPLSLLVCGEIHGRLDRVQGSIAPAMASIVVSVLHAKASKGMDQYA